MLRSPLESRTSGGGPRRCDGHLTPLTFGHPILAPATHGALDSSPAGLSLGTAVEHFLTAKAAEGASPKTLEWHRMVLGRAVRDLGAGRALDSLTPTELRAWLVLLRETLSPISVAGYVRGLKAFGRWCAAEEVAGATALRGLRRPRVPPKLVEPLSGASPTRNHRLHLAA
jgi:hypothetical protein